MIGLSELKLNQEHRQYQRKLGLSRQSSTLASSSHSESNSVGFVCETMYEDDCVE